jgi:hypothetical protein
MRVRVVEEARSCLQRLVTVDLTWWVALNPPSPVVLSDTNTTLPSQPQMRVTMCSQFFILAAALGVVHLVLPVDASGPPSTTLNASLLSAPRANRATTIDIASTTDTTSTCPAVPLVPLVPEPRNRGFNSADASGDTATILGSTCVGPPVLSDQCASFSDRSFYKLLVGNCTNVPPSARATVRSKLSVVLGVGLAPTVGNQLCLASVSEHMIACCTDDLCDVYPCDINASSNDDDGTSSLWSSPPFFQLNSTAILADSHVNDCTMDCMLSVGSCPTVYTIDRTALSVAESNIWHRAYNIPTHHSSLSSVDITIRGDPESRDEDHAGAYSTVSSVTTTHVEWTDSACALFNLYANTSASCQPNDVVTVLATATALFSVFLLATDQHFPVPICVMLSLAYWSSALWIAWGVSAISGGILIIVVLVCRETVLLFGDRNEVHAPPINDVPVSHCHVNHHNNFLSLPLVKYISRQVLIIFFCRTRSQLVTVRGAELLRLTRERLPQRRYDIPHMSSFC